MDSGREANKQTKLSSFFNKRETYTLPSRWLTESLSPPAKKRPVGRPRKNFATEELSSLRVVIITAICDVISRKS